MSNFVKYSVPEILIKNHNVQACLDAINRLHSDEELLAHAHGRSSNLTREVRECCWYSWVPNPKNDEGFSDLKEAFRAWKLHEDPCGVLKDGDFVYESGDFNNKLGQPEIFLNAIAPFVEGTVEIVCNAESGVFKWVIKDGKCFKQYGRITFKDNAEYILCAAIHRDDEKTHAHQPKNIESGYVLCGTRHCNCFISRTLIDKKREERRVQQGFVTSKQRFLNREESARVAIAANQVEQHDLLTKDGVPYLMSEDLY